MTTEYEGELDTAESTDPLEGEPSLVDPFDDPTALAQLNFITLGRIYDVLFALLDEQNPDKATFLADLHRNGGFLMSSPRFTAHFVDDANATEQS